MQTMFMKPFRQAIVVCIIVLIGACEKDFEGDRNTLSMPETYAIVDTVKRDSANFLSTTVTAHWWGESKSGYITGYEVSVDNMQTWTPTTQQSGTFTLELPEGLKEGLLPIYIRAIDNKQQRDPTPATMRFPVRNTAPRIVFDAVANKRPARTFPIIRSVWNSIDVDGTRDIDRYELVLNDTTLPLYVLQANFITENTSDSVAVVAVRFESVRNGTTFANECLVYTGSKTTPASTQTLKGITYNTVNTLYVRAIDRTGNISAWATDNFYVKAPNSDVLLVNALIGSPASALSFYANTLRSPLVNISSFDTLVGISSITGPDEFYPDAVTQSRTFSLFKKIIWLTDEPNTLTTLQQNTVDFFNSNGKAFIYCEFATAFPDNSPILNFTPIERLYSDSLQRNFRLNINAQANGYTAGWPVVRTSGIVNRSVRPFATYTFNTGLFRYDTLMRADITIQGAGLWPGVSTVMSKRVRTATNKADIIITTLPLQNMNANSNADSLFRKVFIDELEF
jgi:hypothetical protein